MSSVRARSLSRLGGERSLSRLAGEGWGEGLGGEGFRRAPLTALSIALAALALYGCNAQPAPEAAAAQAQAAPSALDGPLQAQNAEAAKLYRVVETYFDQYLELNPIHASSLGDHRFDDRFGDYASLSWVADSLGIVQEALEKLDAVDPKQLKGEDLLTYEAFKSQRELEVGGYRYPQELLAINQFYNWPKELVQLASGKAGHPFNSTRDYDNFLSRMDGYVRWTEQAINNLRAGVSKGVVLPKIVVERTLPQLEAIASIEDPRQSPFWQPLYSMPAGPTVEDRKRLIAAYDEKIRKDVLPAYRRLHDYLQKEYLPHARDTVGMSALPSGDLWYAYLVRYHTSTDLTPQQVHELGLREVTRLRANLAALQSQLGVAGDTRTVLDAMRADPKFQFKQPQELLAGYEALRARVNANLPALFGRLPKTGFEIRAVEAYREATEAAASYQPPSADGTRPGVFYVNTYQLQTRPSYMMEPVFLHEAIPGHHFQVALAQETQNLPRFRRFDYITAFGEGWGLYAESLGPELGLYADPYARFGALTLELWRAVRLVVDTGLHSQGWSRERAVEYMRANTSLGEADIAAEVDRYIAWPGQATAYKLGQLKILELRARAQQQLGERFDLREFHDQVIGSGPLPLSVLERKIDRWIASRRS
jgi:uncharacterized protein (DUF885 family)